MTELIRHYVNDMDETKVQHCLFCGEVVCDLRNIMYLLDDGPPKGFAAGPVYVSSGNPKQLISQDGFDWMSPEIRPDFKDCRNDY
jgi:hypothetical protein